LSANPTVCEFVDVGRVETLLDHWPKGDDQYWENYRLYANHLFSAVSLASWLDVNF